VIALAVVHQLLQGVAQAHQLGDALVQFVDVGIGQGLHVGARAPPVAPQGEQVAHFLQREAQVPRAADEGEAVQVLLAVLPVAAVAAAGLGEQADGFVVADHLRGEPALLRGLADVHAAVLLG